MSTVPSISIDTARLIAKKIKKSLDKSLLETKVKIPLSAVQEAVAHAWGARNFDTLCGMARTNPSEPLASPVLDGMLKCLDEFEPSLVEAKYYGLSEEEDEDQVCVGLSTPRITEDLILKAKQLDRSSPSNENDFDAASCTKLVKKYPEFMRARLSMGNYFHRNSDLKGAVKEWESVVMCALAGFINAIARGEISAHQHAPNMFTLTNAAQNAARAYLAAGEYTAAHRLLKLIHEIVDQPHPWATGLWIQALLHLRKYSEAFHLAGEFVRDPEDPESADIFFGRIISIAAIDNVTPDLEGHIAIRHLLNQGLEDYPFHAEYIINPDNLPPKGAGTRFLDNRGPLQAWDFIGKFKKIFDEAPDARQLIAEAALAMSTKLTKARAEGSTGFRIRVREL